MRTLETDLLGIQKKSKGINSRQKGIKNERKVALILGNWAGEKFARVPSSGGLRWVDTVNACGDLICQNKDFDFPFSVETKDLKELTFPSILTKRSKVFSIYSQARSDAERAKKCPLMILKKTGLSDYVCYAPFEVENITALSQGEKEGVYLYGYSFADLVKSDFDVFKNLGSEYIQQKY